MGDRKGGLRTIGKLWKSEEGRKSIATGFLDFGLLGQVRLIVMPAWGEGKGGRTWNILMEAGEVLVSKIEVTSDPDEVARREEEARIRRNDEDIPFGKVGGAGPNDPSHSQSRAAQVQPRDCPVFKLEPGHKPGEDHVKDLATPPVRCTCVVTKPADTSVDDDIPF